MIGDPLNLLVILRHGAWQAWDLKFIIAKAILAFGTGLCVLRLTNALGLSVLMEIASLWIGYFAYRYNHPAIFGYCYAPWLLLPWLHLASIDARGKQGMRAAAGWCLLLAAANFIEFSSGSVKEPIAQILCIGAAGLVYLASSGKALSRPLWLLITGAWLVLLLISAPLWVVFAGSLRECVNGYGDITAWQLSPGLVIGFFDDIFSQNLTTLESHAHPSGNFLFLAGILWLIAAGWGKGRIMRRRSRVLFLSALPPALLVFGIIPPGVISAIPFLGNIGHIHNTFGCPLLILAAMLAALGLRDCFQVRDERSWARIWRTYLLFAAGIVILYIGTASALLPEEFHVTKNHFFTAPFFSWYASALVLALAAAPLLIRWISQGDLRPVFALAAVFFILLFRNGQYLETKFDDYVVNPRLGFQEGAASDAMAYIRESCVENPGRAVGFGSILCSGESAMFNIEGVSGPDALKNRWYQGLREAAHAWPARDWEMRVDEPKLPNLKRFLDFLNVRFYLRNRAELGPGPPGLEEESGMDLTLYQSAPAWPRAFFTDSAVACEGPEAMLALLSESDGQPFAAFPPGKAPPVESLGALKEDRAIAPATSYRLTCNTTTFEIEASGPGVAVLQECYEADNFHATVDGVEAPYYRVNEAFKAVYIPKAGPHVVSFSYWPAHLTAALFAAAAGFIVAAAALLQVFARR